jgi:2'-5' RNA ligase
MKSVIRAFIAIELSPEIRTKLEAISHLLKNNLKDVPVRWVQPGNIHLTLKFLGDVSVANLEVLKQALDTEVSTHAAFDISIGEVGAFPNARRARVIWIGVEAPTDLKNIQHGINVQMERLGYEREARRFSPHLTLGRIARNANSTHLRKIGAALESIKVGFLGAVRVQSVYLFKSDLQPAGAIYTCIHTSNLKP